MRYYQVTFTAALCGFVLASAAAAAPPGTLQDQDKQLVVDHRVVARTENVDLVQGRVEKCAANPLFQADRSWENSLNNLYPNVIYDADARLFKLWYKCVLVDPDAIAKLDPPRTVHDVGWLLLYATSRDGLAWEKPLLGLHSFAGSAANNAVARDTPNVGVFRDTNPACPPDRLFKMIYDVGLGEMRVRFSADGIRWSEPIPAEGLGARVGDTHNNAFWDERLGKYVLISRLVLGERLVARSESDDFIHWGPATLALRSTLEEGRGRQTYCMPSFAYGSGYFGLVMMYNVGRDRTVDCELAWSPDSIRWQRLFPGQPLIPRGEEGACDSKCIYAQANPPIVREGRMWIYYGGDDFEHTGWKRHCLPCLATLRVDGFAGYRHAGQIQANGPLPAGRIVTHPLRISADSLTVSADAAGGTLCVQVLDDAQRIVATSEPIEGNVDSHAVRWKEEFDFATLRDRVVHLIFRLDRATLYAFRGLRPLPPAEQESVAAVRELPMPEPLPGAKTVVAHFDVDTEGWTALDRIEHLPAGGQRNGFVRASRNKYQPYLLAEPSAMGGRLTGNWPAAFGGQGVRIAFSQRASAPHTGSTIEIFARDIAQWSFSGLPPATSDWRQVATSLRFDWTDAEARAAGWRPSIHAFSWQETIRHVGRLVIFPQVRDEHLSFDVDEVSLTALGQTQPESP